MISTISSSLKVRAYLIMYFGDISVLINTRFWLQLIGAVFRIGIKRLAGSIYKNILNHFEADIFLGLNLSESMVSYKDFRNHFSATPLSLGSALKPQFPSKEMVGF